MKHIMYNTGNFMFLVIALLDYYFNNSSFGLGVIFVVLGSTIINMSVMGLEK